MSTLEDGGLEDPSVESFNAFKSALTRLINTLPDDVILAGSSLFPLSWAKSRFLTVLVVVLARAARDFSRIWAYGHLKSQKFRWPAGACAQSGLPTLQGLEHLLGLIGLSKYWIN